MARKRKNRFLELGKDLAIVLLALSAIYLALSGQMGGGWADNGTGWLSTVTNFFGQGGGTKPTTDRPEGGNVELRPLRMSVNVAGIGTYGVQYDIAATDKLADKMFSILGEALGSAGVPEATTEQVWRAALANRSNIYFDFQGQVPLSVLYAWTEAGPGEGLAQESTRRLLLAEDEAGALTLYYNNETTGMYYACHTADTLNGHLQSAVAPYAANVNSVTFAFQHKRGEGYEKLAPYVMLSKSKAPAARTVYRSTNPIAGGQNNQTRVDLIQALDFHPQANTSYVAGGKQVVREGTDTLEVYDSGKIYYHSASAEAPKYPVGDGVTAPSALELVAATQHLALASVGALCGDGRTAGIYLMGVTDLGNDEWQVDYGYQLGGAVVQLGAGYAARFVISGGRISDFYLVLRTYNATEEQTTVLPELQAAAAMGALDADGKELLLVYEDDGTTDTVRASWIAQS